jgi:glycosyltransferase involved in cell wall biosynthesis
VTGRQRPLRIALAIGTLGLGGAETQVVGLAGELKRAGSDVEVILLAARGPLQVVLDEAGVPSYCADYPGLRFRNQRRQLRPWLAITDLARLIALAAHLRRRRFDVIHAFLIHAYGSLVPLAWLLGVPVRVAARRGLHASLPRTFTLPPLTALSTLLASAVVANSTAVAEDARVREHVPPFKLRVIPNAVTLLEDQGDPSGDPPVGLLIANLIHYKGHLDLVRAMRLLDLPPLVRCVGEGPMRAEIEAAICAAGLEDVMTLEGSKPSARSLYAGVQFGLLVSHAEGMPNAILEAMAAGLPVITTDVGGCRELVVDGVTGLVVPARDPERLAGALRKMTEDNAFRIDAGKAARRRAEEYSWGASAQAHLRCYNELFARSEQQRT